MKYVFQHFWSWYDVLPTVQLSYKNSLSFNELLSFLRALNRDYDYNNHNNITINHNNDNNYDIIIINYDNDDDDDDHKMIQVMVKCPEFPFFSLAWWKKNKNNQNKSQVGNSNW